MAISNASNQIVKVNLIPGIIPSVLHLSQYDTGAGRPVTFSVYDGSQAFTIPSGVSIAFEGTKPDGNGFSFTCSKSGSNALLTNYTNQMTALSGKIMCQLVFTNASGGRVGSLPVLMVVTPAGINGDTVISDSDIEAIVAAQNAYAVLNAKLDTAISAATQDSEVQDIRVKADGTSAATAGNAVREQITELKNDLNALGLSGNIIDEYHSGESLTNAGITFTKNADGTVSSSGTASGQARYYWLYKHTINPGTYILSGSPSDAGYQSFYLQYAVVDANATPAASDYQVAINPATIVVGEGKNISIRTWYKAGYVDNGHYWSTKLVNANNPNALDGKYNPDIFVPLIYSANANADTALTDVENIKSMIYTDIDLTWKQYNQTGSATYDYIKCAPLEVSKSAELTALIPDTYTQYNVVKYASLSDAQAGYDANIGTGNQLSATGWMNAGEYTIQRGYYIILLRHTNRNAIVSEGDIISIIKSNLLDVSDIAAVNSKLPIFFDKEVALANTVQLDRDSNTITFTLSADNHYNDYDRLDKMQTDYAVQMSRISKDIGVDFIGTLGDIIEGFDDYLPTSDYYNNYHNINERRLTDMALAYSNDDLPFIYVSGHHEMYPVRDDTNAETFEQNRGFYTNDLKVIMYGQRRPGVQGTNNYNVGYRKFNAVDISGISGGADYDQKSGVSASYYFDITKNGSKIRIIVIDSCAYTAFGYSPETVTFIDAALTDAQTNSIPCIILSHIPFRWQQYRNGAGAVPANEAAFDSVIIAHSSIIKAYLHGHTHCDNIVTSETLNSENVAPYADITFPLISLACQKTAQVQQAAGYFIGDFHAYGYRNPAEYTGYCFTVINYHLDTGVIKMFRYGAGDTGTYPTWTV